MMKLRYMVPIIYSDDSHTKLCFIMDEESDEESDQNTQLQNGQLIKMFR